jgi:hypothetical protein
MFAAKRSKQTYHQVRFLARRKSQCRLLAILAEKELRLIAERRLLYRPHQFSERASRSDNGNGTSDHVGRTFPPLGLWGILVLDLGNGISGFAKSDQHSLGEMNTFFVTFRHWVPRRAVPRTGMINESGFDGACYDDKGVF